MRGKRSRRGSRNSNPSAAIDLLRLKAIVALSDRPDQPAVLHGVQHLFHPPVLLPESPSEDHRTRMVFITRDLPCETIENFLVSAGSIAAATAFAGSARAVMGPDDKFDLVIKGGEVLDPSQSLRGRRDIRFLRPALSYTGSASS